MSNSTAVAVKPIFNIAIIAHVDHGKTTLVDAMLRQSGTFRSNEAVAERVMDSNDLERERGITILAKNTALYYHDNKINIVDTPGHADFGGEVERALKMVDGVVLLVDASEGPLPQTRYVLSKALEASSPRWSSSTRSTVPTRARRKSSTRSTTSSSTSTPTRPCSTSPSSTPTASSAPRPPTSPSPAPTCSRSSSRSSQTIPVAKGDPEGAVQILVTNLDYSDYLGRLAIGRVFNGTMRTGQEYNVATPRRHLHQAQDHQALQLLRPQAHRHRRDPGRRYRRHRRHPRHHHRRELLRRRKSRSRCRRSPSTSRPSPSSSTSTTAPFAGREGKFVTSRNLRDRLDKELLTNVSLKMQDTGSPDAFKVLGRGELQLAILIEMMRREGFEMMVCRPEIVTKRIDGQLMEPVEHLYIDIPENFVGTVIERLGPRKGEMTKMTNHGSGRVRMEFRIPSRGLIGLRSEMLTETRGTIIMNSILDGYVAYQGEIPQRASGALISDRQGTTTAYALEGLQDRGILFVADGIEVYEGMIIGEHSRDNDLDVNCVREKKLSNMRASGSDDAVRLVPYKQLTLEQCIEFIADDELVEVTPKSLRMRKKVLQANRRPRKGPSRIASLIA